MKVIGRETLLYLSDFEDEAVPNLGAAGLSLAGWAEWLAHPDPDWSRPSPATHGETFRGHYAEVVRYEVIVPESGWTAETAPPAPGTADGEYVICHGDMLGWDVDTMTSGWPMMCEQLGGYDGGQFFGPTGPYAGRNVVAEIDCSLPEKVFRFEIVNGEPSLVDCGVVQ